MKTLTKKQKIEAYKYALEMIRNCELQEMYTCDKLYDCLCINNLDDPCISLNEEIKRHFPEFYKKMPKNHNRMASWPQDQEGRKTRIDILTEIISELENENH